MICFERHVLATSCIADCGTACVMSDMFSLVSWQVVASSHQAFFAATIFPLLYLASTHFYMLQLSPDAIKVNNCGSASTTVAVYDNSMFGMPCPFRQICTRVCAWQMSAFLLLACLHVRGLGSLQSHNSHAAIKMSMCRHDDLSKQSMLHSITTAMLLFERVMFSLLMSTPHHALQMYCHSAVSHCRRDELSLSHHSVGTAPRYLQLPCLESGLYVFAHTWLD